MGANQEGYENTGFGEILSSKPSFRRTTETIQKELAQISEENDIQKGEQGEAESHTSTTLSVASLSTLACDDETDSTKEEEEDSRKSIVSFGAVHVRLYNRTVGDHPDVRCGPPVTLGWEFNECDPMQVDQYENFHKKGLRKLSSITRKNMLKNVFGVSEDEIRASEKEVQKILKMREKSKKRSKLAANTQEKTLSLRKKIKKTFSSKNISKVLALAASPMSLPMSMN